QHPDHAHHGFHYVDWVFDGDDIVFVSRTAFDDANGGAHTYHDANYLTFHRIERFRDAKSAPVPAQDAGAFSVSGTGFELATLDEGARAFSNRKYVWQTVPPSLRGLRYTRVAGGESSHVRVRAKKDATIFAAAKADAAPPGFTREAGAT